MLKTKQLAAWSGGTWRAAPPPEVRGVGIDTRTLRAGDLFVALRGEHRDGHEFLEEAARQGAGGAVVAAEWPATAAPLPCLAVSDTLTALGRMAAGYRSAVNPRVVGITGSVGKSTVKEMTTCMLAAGCRVEATQGNWNNRIGLPLSLLAMQATVQAAVLEMGTNHPGELDVLCDMARPDMAIVTNVGAVHTEFFASIEAIAEEKATVLRRLPKTGLAVLNRDHDYFELLRSKAPCAVLTVSLREAADYRCLRWDPATREALIHDRAAGEDVVLSLPLPGDFNVLNAMLAAAVARRMEIPWSAIQLCLRGYRGLALRWERCDRGGYAIVNDSYNANPMNMRGSLRAFQEEYATGKRWLLLAGMLELGERERSEHLALGHWIGEGDWSGVITVGALGALIADGAAAAGFPEARLFRCADTPDAVATIRERVGRGSRILVKGSRQFHLERIVEALGAGGAI